LKRHLFVTLVLCLGLFVLIANQTVTHAELSVKPLSLRLGAETAEESSATLNIRNRGESVTEASLQIADWWRTEEGNLQMLPPNSRDRSAADWIVFSPSNFSLEPGERRQVSVEASIPEDIEGDHWAMILLTEESQNEETEDQVQTRISVGYAIKILVEAPSSESKGSITNIELIQKDPLKIKVGFENRGNGYIKTKGTVEIRNLEGYTIRSTEIKEFPTLPGETRELKVSDLGEKPLASGTYYAIVVMDYGGDQLIQGGLPIEIQKNAEESTA